MSDSYVILTQQTDISYIDFNPQFKAYTYNFIYVCSKTHHVGNPSCIYTITYIEYGI